MCSICIFKELLSGFDRQQIGLFDHFRAYSVQWLKLDVLESLIIAGDGADKDGIAD